MEDPGACPEVNVCENVTPNDVVGVTLGVNVIVGVPTGVGGSVECASNLGGVSITAIGWTEITSNHYESTDYDTASQTLTVIIQTDVGGISAIFT